MSISALIFAGTIYRLELICHSLKGFLLHDQTTFLLIYHKFCWITTNAYICQKCNVHSLSESENGIFLFLSQATMYLHLVNPCSSSLTPDKYHKSTIKLHWGLITFKHIWGGGGGGCGAYLRGGAYLKWQRWLYHSPKRTRIQSGKAQVQEVGGHVTKDQKQNWTSSWWMNHPGSVHRSFTVVIDYYSLSFISEG